MKKITLLLLILLAFNCQGNSQEQSKTVSNYKVTKSEHQWKKELSPQAYHVLREAGTEQAHSSPLNKNYKQGTYVCIACKTPLFKSDYKFDSGTGWPSFDREIKGNIAYITDYNLGHARTEEHCATCGGHLGHVFNDGPRETTGKRHCINGVALEFISK